MPMTHPLYNKVQIRSKTLTGHGMCTRILAPLPQSVYLMQMTVVTYAVITQISTVQLIPSSCAKSAGNLWDHGCNYWGCTLALESEMAQRSLCPI